MKSGFGRDINAEVLALLSLHTHFRCVDVIAPYVEQVQEPIPEEEEVNPLLALVEHYKYSELYMVIKNQWDNLTLQQLTEAYNKAKCDPLELDVVFSIQDLLRQAVGHKEDGIELEAEQGPEENYWQDKLCYERDDLAASSDSYMITVCGDADSDAEPEQKDKSSGGSCVVC